MIHSLKQSQESTVTLGDWDSSKEYSIKQNVKSDKPFTLNAHMKERLEQ